MKLREIDWINILDDVNDLDKYIEIFTHTYLDTTKSNILNKTVTIRNLDKPWLHNEIRKQIRIRKRIHKAAKRVNTPDQWSLFRRQRNMILNKSYQECKSDTHIIVYYQKNRIQQVIFRP